MRLRWECNTSASVTVTVTVQILIHLITKCVLCLFCCFAVCFGPVVGNGYAKSLCVIVIVRSLSLSLWVWSLLTSLIRCARARKHPRSRAHGTYHYGSHWISRGGGLRCRGCSCFFMHYRESSKATILYFCVAYCLLVA